MAGVVVTMSGDEARLFRAMAKVLEQQDKLNSKLKDTAKNSDDVGKRSKDAFEKSGLSLNKMSASLVTYAAGLASVTGAVGLLRSGWEQVRKEQEAGLSQLQRTQGQDRRLLQISNSAQDFDQLRSQADSLASQFGVDRAVVREVIFSAVSENFRDAVPAIIAASQVIDPQAAAGVAGQVPALFKGAIGALEAVNLTLKAAQASRLDFEQIARSLPQAAEGGSIAKSTAEETLAVLSVLASEFKSGDTAADRIKAFATAAGINEQFAGQGIIAVVEKLQQMDAEGRSKFLGSSAELNVAYVKMSENLALIKQRIGEFNQETKAFAGGGGLLAQQSAIAAADPQSIALINEAKARQAFESAQAGIMGILGATVAEGISAGSKLLLEQDLLSRVFGTAVVPVVATGSAEFGLSGQTGGALGAGASELLSGTVRGAAAGPFAALIPVGEKLLEVSTKLENAANKLDAASARMGNTTPAARAAASGASF